MPGRGRGVKRRRTGQRLRHEQQPDVPESSSQLVDIDRGENFFNQPPKSHTHVVDFEQIIQASNI